jgi:hypothetical protein
VRWGGRDDFNLLADLPMNDAERKRFTKEAPCACQCLDDAAAGSKCTDLSSSPANVARLVLRQSCRALEHHPKLSRMAESAPGSGPCQVENGDWRNGPAEQVSAMEAAPRIHRKRRGAQTPYLTLPSLLLIALQVGASQCRAVAVRERTVFNAGFVGRLTAIGGVLVQQVHSTVRVPPKSSRRSRTGARICRS